MIKVIENEKLSDRELDRKIKILQNEQKKRQKEKNKKIISKYIGSLLDLVY